MWSPVIQYPHYPVTLFQSRFFSTALKGHIVIRLAVIVRKLELHGILIFFYNHTI